jgi:hypothetical protein
VAVGDSGPDAKAVPRPWQHQLLWVLGFAAYGFIDSALFAGLLGLERRLFLIPHVGLTAALALAYLRWNGVSLRRLLTRRWKAGLLWAVVFSAVSLTKVFSHPASTIANGWQLALDILWSGAAYGITDAVLLTVLPVIAVSRAFSAAGWSRSSAGRAGMRIAALAATMVIAFTYHFGFPEYRDRPADLWGAAYGNGVMTVGYLVSGSVLTPLGSHVVVHVAAVLRGPGTSTLMPPHPAD